MRNYISFAKDIVEKQNYFRNNTINLIASENIMPKEAAELYCSDFMYRYAEGKPYARYYNGTKYVDMIEEETIQYFKHHFNVDFVDVRPISGAIANLCVFSALKKEGVVITNSLPSGGHITHNKMGTLGKILHYKIFNFPPKEDCPFETDVDKTIELIEDVSPDFVVFGKSLFLFPEPVKTIRKAFPELMIVYDAAHVFGLIYQDEFQKPLEEGANIITASTHKTFPGPQGGIIIAKQPFNIDKYIFPGIVSNHHLHRLPSLLVTAYLLDTKLKDYGKKVIENAKWFASQLYKKGFNVVCKEKGFTESHQVVLDVSEIGSGTKVANTLERNNIIVNKNALPWDKSVVDPSGIRIGVQEMTLRGWDKEDFKILAERFEEILLK